MTRGRAFGAASLNPPQWATRRPASPAGRRLSRCLLFVQGRSRASTVRSTTRTVSSSRSRSRSAIRCTAASPGAPKSTIVGVQIQQAQADKVLQPGAGVSSSKSAIKDTDRSARSCKHFSAPVESLSGFPKKRRPISILFGSRFSYKSTALLFEKSVPYFPIKKNIV